MVTLRENSGSVTKEKENHVLWKNEGFMTNQISIFPQIIMIKNGNIMISLGVVFLGDYPLTAHEHIIPLFLLIHYEDYI